MLRGSGQGSVSSATASGSSRTMESATTPGTMQTWPKDGARAASAAPSSTSGSRPPTARAIVPATCTAEASSTPAATNGSSTGGVAIEERGRRAHRVRSWPCGPGRSGHAPLVDRRRRRRRSAALIGSAPGPAGRAARATLRWLIGGDDGDVPAWRSCLIRSWPLRAGPTRRSAALIGSPAGSAVRRGGH